MTAIVKKAQKQVDENYAFFEKQEDDLKKDHLGAFALLRNRKIINFFNDEDDAITVGMKDYGEGNFSVQQVGGIPVDLGYRSYLTA